MAAPAVGWHTRALPDRQAAQARTLSLTARLSLGRVTVFTYSNLVHGPAEKGLPGQGRLFERIYAVGAYAKRPQRLGAAEPQPKCERPLNRRDAMNAEKTAGEKILLEMRDSALLHCKGRCDGMSLEGRRGIAGANLVYFQARPGQHTDAGYGQSPAAVER
jgi:hypothetical protein